MDVRLALGRVRVMPNAWRGLALALGAVLIAAYLAGSVRVLQGRVAHQVAVTGHEFVLSDLFPRWYGARLLVSGQNPYTLEANRNLQVAFYGQDYSASEEVRLFRSKVGFFYPPYVVLSLLPLLWMDFEVARWAAFAGLAAAMAVSALLWARLAGVSPTRRAVILGALAIGTFHPLLDVLWLQQLSGLVLLYVVGAYVVAARGTRASAFVAGALLALAMIKPQVVFLPAAGLLAWSLWNPTRRPLVAGFAAAIVAQLALAERLLPGWLSYFLAETGRYQELNTSVFWLPSMVTGSVMSGLVLIATPTLAVLGALWWRARRLPATSAQFVWAATATFAAAAAFVPADSSLYNRCLLVVPLMALLAPSVPACLAARTVTRLTALAVATPAILMAISGLASWSGAASAWVTLPSLASSVLYVLLPLALLPAIVFVALTTQGDAGRICAYHQLRRWLARLRPRTSRSDGAARETARPAAPSGPDGGPLPLLDGMRGAAALYVVCHHAYRLLWVGTELPAMLASGQVPQWISGLAGVLDFGRQAVLLFFVLSGFCIHYRQALVLSRPAASNPRGPHWGVFALRRVWRLYPTMVFALGMTALLDYAGSRVNPDLYATGAGWPEEIRVWLGGARYDLSTAVGNLAMQGGLAVPWLGSNGPLWSLAFEFWFYVAYPVVYLVSRRLGAAGMFRLTLAISIVSGVMHAMIGGWVLRVAAYWFVWTAGALTAEAYAGRLTLRGLRFAGPAALLTIGAAVAFGEPGSLVLIEQLWGALIAVAFAYAVLALPEAAQATATRVSARLRLLASFSYSLYITHYPVMVLTAAWWLAEHDALPTDPQLAVGGVVVSLLVGVATWVLVERWSLIPVSEALSRVRRVAPPAALPHPVSA